MSLFKSLEKNKKHQPVISKSLSWETYLEYCCLTKKDGSILFEDLYLYSGFLFLGVLHGCTLLILTGQFICVPSSLFRFFIVCLHHKFLWKEYNWALILNWKSLIIIFILLTTISYYMTEKANKGIWCISFS